MAKIFPGVILNPYTVNRSHLAKIVFKQPRELVKLTNILYPEALKAVKSQISLYRHASFVILDVPLLFESGWDKITDVNVVVKATRRQQIDRAQKRLRLTRGDVLRRLKNQMPLRKKCQLADIVIDNSRDLKHTLNQVDEIIDRLRKRTT